MVGKTFRLSALSLPGGDEFIKLIGQNIKKLTKFKNDYAPLLKDIRIAFAAHRDNDLSQQLRIVYELNPNKVALLMAEFDSILNELGSTLQKGMNLLPSKGHI